MAKTTGNQRVRNTKATDPIHTPIFRVSFPSLFEPEQNPETGEVSGYSITMLIPKTLTDPKDIEAWKQLRLAMQKAIQDGKRELWNGIEPEGLKKPIKDGDRKDPEKYPGYAGNWIVKAKSNRRPGIVDQKVQPIPASDADRVYAGCWGRAVVSACAFSYKGDGVKFYLDAFQLVKDDVPFGRFVDATTAFEAVSDPNDLGDDLMDDMANELEDLDEALS